MANKKAWKLQEFVANDSVVTSASFGHKSGRMMATGGQDGSLGLWHIGSTNCITCLSPLTSSVESIKFNPCEEIVCAGSKSGFLRIYNLSTSKVIRHLPGHKAAVRCIDFHPYGDFLVSCSDDHKVRMWDIRRKGCIYTYKDHSDKVNQVQFSPDGKWVAAASDDSTCKLWDITAGKMLHELKDHQAPVKCLQFHPREFLLATGSTDRTSKVYDVEQFKLLSTSPLESHVIEQVSFAESGEYIYSASQDCFKTYSWDPNCIHLDTVLVKWGRPSDVYVGADKLMGCSYNQNLVSVHMVDLKNLNYNRTSVGVTTPHYSISTNTTTGNTATPRTVTDQLHHEAVKRNTRENKQTRRQLSYSPSRSTNHQRTIPRSSSISKDVKPSITQKLYPEEEKTIFAPKNSLARSPTRELHLANLAAAATAASKPPPIVVNDSSSNETNLKYHYHLGTKNVDEHFKSMNINPSSCKSDPHQQLVPSPAAAQPNNYTNDKDHDANITVVPVPSSAVGHLSSQNKEEDPIVFDFNNDSFKPLYEQNHNTPSMIEKFTVVKQPFGEGLKPKTAPFSMKIATAVPMERQNPAGLDMNAFLPVRKPTIDLKSAPPVNDRSVMDEIRNGTKSMKIVLTNRRRNLEVVRALWTSGDVATAVNTAVGMQDQSIVIDLLNVINIKPSLWSLDLCMVMLPQIKALIKSKYETYINVGCDALRLVLKNFSQVITSNYQPPPPSAIDLSREERHHKCKECYTTLLGIRQILDGKQQLSGKLGSRFRELKILISCIE